MHVFLHHGAKRGTTIEFDGGSRPVDGGIMETKPLVSDEQRRGAELGHCEGNLFPMIADRHGNVDKFRDTTRGVG